MSVIVHQVGEARRIEVLGTLEDEAECAELMALFDAVPPERCELSFYDARTLPRAVVERLAQAFAAGRPLRVLAYHSYLVHFLLRLGLPAVAVASHSLHPPCAKVEAVAIGGSADSLDKILRIVEALPTGPVAVFVLQHVLEEQENHLDQLLKVRTGYAVAMPQQLRPIEPGTIYVAPPGHHMKVGNGYVYLTRDRKVQFARPSIDELFISLAYEYRERALGVVLCGYGRDGVAGATAIRQHGGCVLAEAHEECQAAALPDAVAEGSACDFRFTLPEIVSFLDGAVAGGGPAVAPPALDHFLEALFARYGYDFRGYQRGTLQRRLELLGRSLGLASFFELQQEVLGDPQVFERFFLEISIGVTEFFRHPEQFRLLGEQILTYLDSFPRVKIWSAGCATGEEVYSLAILLDELGMLAKCQIFATDINRYLLDGAKGGLFPRDALEKSRANYAAAGGRRRFDDYVDDNGYYLEIAARLRGSVLFHHHSLAHDGVFNEFQLILCRNVLIYFHTDLQRRVMGLLSRSLHRDGYLLLGPSEGGAGRAGDGEFAAVGARGALLRRK